MTLEYIIIIWYTNMSTIKVWLENKITLHKHDNKQEELLNSLTHAIGAALSIAATIIMIFRSFQSSWSNIKGVIIFGISMILLYSASSLYHFTKHLTLKRLLRILDHSNIYLLIAGTYTPICFFMNNKTGWIMFLTIWIFAIAGIIFTLVFWGKHGWLHVAIYLLMGWTVVFFWKQVNNSIPLSIIKWMIAGGVTYSAGIIFYSIKKLPFYHAIWHTFVVAGSACFFFGIYFYLI